MNIYQLIGDICKLLSLLILICRLVTARNAQGISVRTQEIYLIAALSRCAALLDEHYNSLYIPIMKVAYLALHVFVILLMRCNRQISSTYDQQHDNFNHWKFIVLPCTLLGWLNFQFCTSQRTCYRFALIVFLEGVSFLLESVAMVPQLSLLRKFRVVENLTGEYVFFMGLHLIFYIANWIYLARHENRHSNPMFCVGIMGRTSESLLFVDFFYYWVISKMRGTELSYGGEGDFEYYDCDVNELRNYENSTPLIDSSAISMRGETEPGGNEETDAALGNIMPVVSA
ncbi:hypothetical protein HJC23_005500 [Cyclotella cryptica]|uniref:Uncharacterized protein n=1 Tax=Cyclotella cryptica TaxID=29204 RepID=A0ABD3PH77_9STRA